MIIVMWCYRADVIIILCLNVSFSICYLFVVLFFLMLSCEMKLSELDLEWNLS